MRSFIFLALFSVLWSVIEGGSAFALDLTAPFFLENAQVLPPGVRNPRYTNLFMSVESKFNGSGKVEPLGQPLSKTVTWNDVIASQKNDIEKNMIRSTVKGSQLSLDGSPGSTSGQVNTFVDVKVPVLAMGITSNWTLGVAVPVMKVSVSADTGFSRSEDGQKWMKNLCQLSVDQCNQAANKLNDSVNQKLVGYGYEPIQSKTVSNIGDIQLVSKVGLDQNPDQQVTWKSSLILPTGMAPNAGRALDVPTGDGRVQIGNQLIYERRMPADFRWMAFGGAVAQLPNQMEKRVPLASGEALSPDKESLTRQWGANVGCGTSLSHQFVSTGIVTSLGYNFQFMTQPRYSGGTRFSQERYRFLENLTSSQLLHSATLMAGFSTVEWYQNKKFFYPFQANVVLSHPLGGRSVSTSNVLAGELVLFL